MCRGPDRRAAVLPGSYVPGDGTYGASVPQRRVGIRDCSIARIAITLSWPLTKTRHCSSGRMPPGAGWWPHRSQWKWSPPLHASWIGLWKRPAGSCFPVRRNSRLVVEIPALLALACAELQEAEVQFGVPQVELNAVGVGQGAKCRTVELRRLAGLQACQRTAQSLVHRLNRQLFDAVSARLDSWNTHAAWGIPLCEVFLHLPARSTRMNHGGGCIG